MGYVESMLQKCSSFPHIKQLHAHLLVSGLFHLYQPRSKFLDCCATSSAATLPYAAAVFRSVPFPSTNDWNALIRGHAQSHHPINAVTCYLSMSRAPCNCKPDALTCSFFLKACARALARIESLQMHAQVLKSGVDEDVLLQTTLLDVYAKCGDLDNACKMFDEMPKRDVASWNVLISGLAQGNRPNEALKLFDRMSEGNYASRGRMMPNEITVLGALSACSQLGAIREGDRVCDYIRKNHLDENVIVCNAVIDMYAKCGMVEKAYGVFEGMRCCRSIITWNTMVMGFAMDGNGMKAMELFSRMVGGGEGPMPDEVTYLATLCACNHAGMVDEGVQLFEMMEKLGVSKNMKHYGSVVDMLGRAGRLDEAYRIVESMRMPPDAVLWQTLLGASKTYGNVEMAERASRKLAEMGSSACGDFVLLSNVYAARERWNDVGRVRDAMKNMEVKKVPGISYTEMNGVVFQFYNGDKSHPNWKEIYGKVEEITVGIRQFGYEPETNYVLHDIGNEEKENALSYHSEKLALAFGLISTDDRSPININKNLRICGDCHVVMKLVSKLYDREIIVRDRTRFHRFKEGACSCKDFW